jgi:hypothetical protein
MIERRIVEEGLLVTMLIRLVREGSGEVFSGCSLEAGSSLQIAAREVIMQASPTARGKIARRIGNIGDRCVATNVPAATHPTLFDLAVYSILKHLGDEDYLTDGGASRLADAVDLILCGAGARRRGRRLSGEEPSDGFRDLQRRSGRCALPGRKVNGVICDREIGQLAPWSKGPLYRLSRHRAGPNRSGNPGRTVPSLEQSPPEASRVPRIRQ